MGNERQPSTVWLLPRRSVQMPFHSPSAFLVCWQETIATAYLPARVINFQTRGFGGKKTCESAGVCRLITGVLSLPHAPAMLQVEQDLNSFLTDVG